MSNRSSGTMAMSRVGYTNSDKSVQDLLQRNDKEINELFNQGNILDDTLRIQQNRWKRYPDTARDAGLLMPIVTGESSRGGKDTSPLYGSHSGTTFQKNYLLSL